MPGYLGTAARAEWWALSSSSNLVERKARGQAYGPACTCIHEDLFHERQSCRISPWDERISCRSDTMGHNRSGDIVKSRMRRRRKEERRLALRDAQSTSSSPAKAPASSEKRSSPPRR